MKSHSTTSSLRSGTLHLALSALLLGLSACSTPHGYGVDERALRTPDGSSGVVAGSASPTAGTGTPAMQSQSTYLSLITQMQHEGQYFASLAHLDAYDARYGMSPESTLLRADAERMTDQPDLATRSYTALHGTPLAAAGYRGLSLLAGARGDFSSASGLLEEAVRLNSTDAVALSDLGYARMKMGDLAGARIPLMTAAQLAPGNAKVMSNLALYLILDQNQKQAEAVMKSAGVNAQTRHAIYTQASQISQGTVTEPAAGLAPAAAVMSLNTSTAMPGSNQNSALRIDFAMTAPLANDTVKTPILTANQR